MMLPRRVRRVLFPFREEIRSHLTAHPSLYLPIARTRPSTRDQAIRPDTDIVIEGYPRSANSFAVDAFRAAQPRPVRIAHHLHAPAQIIQGVKERTPVLLLLRDPLEAVVSLKALRLEGAHIIQGVPIVASLRHFLRLYARFYEAVWPWRHGLVTGPFPDVIHRFDHVVRRINDRYETDFAIFEPTADRLAQIRCEQGFHAAPSEARSRIKQELDAELASARTTPEAQAATRIYERFRALAE